MFFNKASEVIDHCNKNKLKLYEYTIQEEIKESGSTKESIFESMAKNLSVMKEASSYGMTHDVRSVSGLIGGDALRLKKYIDRGNTLTGEFMATAMARALSCAEVNASMGRIVAAPTAGSSGILPAVLITTAEKLQKKDEDIVNALFTASLVGILIAKNASLSGAEGGCQAECGSASSMAAAAIVEMMGGTPDMCFDAGAITIKNLLGLVCDPLAGLVEVPCAKRNVIGTVNALTSAELVMAGVKSRVPFDEVVYAMNKVSKMMPCELRETAMGGLAITKTGLNFKKRLEEGL